MTLQEKLVAKLSVQDPVGILQNLGYKNITQKSLNRLSQLVNDGDLGLSKSYYDFKYTQLEFIEAICELLSVDFNDHLDDIKVIKNRITQLHRAYHCYIFVDTGFRRKNEPVIALAFSEGRRNIVLPIELRMFALDEQLEFVKAFVTSHFTENNGTLILWGDIKRYVFYYAKDEYVVLSPAGEILNEKAVISDKATVTVANKNLGNLFS